MYSYSRENQDEIMEEIPIFTWEITTKCSQVIFPMKTYLMEDLILLKQQDCYVNQSSYYTFTTEDLSKARKGEAEKRLSLLNTYIGIEQIAKKVKNIPKKVKQLNERNSKRQHVAELLQQNFKNNVVALLANVSLKEVISVKGMLKKGYGYTIGESIRKSKFTPEMKKWIEINSRNEKVNANSACNIRKMMLKELKLPEESISLNTFIRHLGKTCNLSYKNISYPKPTMDSDKTKEQRYFYALELIPPLLQGYIPIFIDEAGISMSMSQKMAWIPRGESLSKDCPTNSEHYTILENTKQKMVNEEEEIQDVNYSTQKKDRKSQKEAFLDLQKKRYSQQRDSDGSQQEQEISDRDEHYDNKNNNISDSNEDIEDKSECDSQFKYSNQSLNQSERSVPRKVKKSYTIDFKIEAIKRRIQEWVDNRETFEQIPKRERSQIRSLKGQQENHKFEDLFRSCYNWILDEWDNQRAVTSDSVIAFFISENESLIDETYRYLINLGSKFRTRYNLALRIPLRRLTKYEDREETTEIEIDQFHDNFVELILKNQYDRDSIYNMDQIAVYFENAPNKILAPRGSKDPRIETQNMERSRITVILLVRADGTKYKPFIIFKGAPGGKIYKQLQELDLEAELTVQQNSWTDTDTLSQWIEYFKEIVNNNQYLLIADSYNLHQSQLMNIQKTKINQNILLIPPSLTGILQPLDVGINHKFKENLRKQWVFDQQLDIDKERLTQQVIDSWNLINKDIIINSFGKCYPYLNQVLE
ncbi:hypothetical protein ABPG72_003261 [Tetrahymena utriculariae]